MLTAEEIEEKFQELLINAPDDDFGNDIKQNANNFTTDQKEFLIDNGDRSDRWLKLFGFSHSTLDNFG